MFGCVFEGSVAHGLSFFDMSLVRSAVCFRRCFRSRTALGGARIVFFLNGGEIRGSALQACYGWSCGEFSAECEVYACVCLLCSGAP